MSTDSPIKGRVDERCVEKNQNEGQIKAGVAESVKEGFADIQTREELAFQVISDKICQNGSKRQEEQQIVE